MSGTYIPHIYDAHLHLHLDQRPEGQAPTHALLSALGGAALMSTAPTDWEAASALARAHPHARCLLGIHPWYAHAYAGAALGGWMEALRHHLKVTPKSAIGEIGLDRRWRPPGLTEVQYTAQREVFIAQVTLAADLELPVSVHCVHAHGDLQQLLSDAPRLPPAIYLHAFGGARGTVEQLVRARRYGDRLYFGFAACVNLRSPKTAEVIRAVPQDRVVVESDRASHEEVAQELELMLGRYAELFGWSGVAEAADRTARNARALYGAAGR